MEREENCFSAGLAWHSAVRGVFCSVPGDEFQHELRDERALWDGNLAHMSLCLLSPKSRAFGSVKESVQP